MDLFGVLGKENCWFFYILSVLSLIAFIGGVIGAIVITKDKTVIMLIAALWPLAWYYIWRLLYSMCEKSLQ